MLYLPQGPTVYRILSIDPGTNTLGMAVTDIELASRQVGVIYATTLIAKGKENAQLEETFGGRHARIEYHRQQIRLILTYYQPNVVISESPYMGRHAQAFEALVECLYMLRQTVSEYDPGLCLETIDPPTVKIAVGAPGRGGDKDLVRQGVYQQAKLLNLTGLSFNVLDDHAIDAIAVGCYKVKTLDPTLL